MGKISQQNNENKINHKKFTNSVKIRHETRLSHSTGKLGNQGAWQYILSPFKNIFDLLFNFSFVHTMYLDPINSQLLHPLLLRVPK